MKRKQWSELKSLRKIVWEGAAARRDRVQCARAFVSHRELRGRASLSLAHLIHLYIQPALAISRISSPPLFALPWSDYYLLSAARQQQKVSRIER
jgi:hypothetical protein